MNRILRIAWAVSGAASLCFGGACLPVSGSRIEARDLAAADRRFAGLPATLVIGFAPLPGARRVFTAQELMRLAKANGITLDGTTDEICFEVPVHPLTDREVGDAMRKSLPDGTSVSIVELQKVSAPAGVLEFPLESLEPATPASPSVQLWRGHIRYAESRQMPAWARVEVQARFTAVVALEDIAAGAVIRPGSVRVETRTGSIQREPVAPRVEDVAGRVARRTIRAGALVPVSALAEAPSVHRGDSVAVEVESGPAHLRFDAIAERAGSKGDLIDLRNPINGKTFRARLGEGARASIVIAGGVR